LNRICSLITQQERQTFGDQSRAMTVTTIGDFKNNVATYANMFRYGGGSYGRGYTYKV